MIDKDAVVLAIAENDTLVHVGPAEDLAFHYDQEQPAPPEGKQWPAVEFYDNEGFHLVHVPVAPPADAGFDRDAGYPEPTDADRQLLLDRIDLALAHAQVGRDRLLAAGSTFEGPERIVRVSGDLPTVLMALDAVDQLGSHSDTSRGGWFHNLMHSVFG